MDKKILLTIKGSHHSIEGENSSIELITEGRLFTKDDIYYIEYEESEISGMQGTKTLISVQDDSIMMERSGTHSSQFWFEKGRKYINSYNTPFGVMQMEIYSTKVKHDLNDSEGKLDLKYQLALKGSYASNVYFTLFNILKCNG